MSEALSAELCVVSSEASAAEKPDVTCFILKKTTAATANTSIMGIITIAARSLSRLSLMTIGADFVLLLYLSFFVDDLTEILSFFIVNPSLQKNLLSQADDNIQLSLLQVSFFLQKYKICNNSEILYPK